MKKVLGNISCLALLFVFTVSLIVIPDPVEATDNYQFSQTVTRYYVCNSGEVWGSDSYILTTQMEVDHPPDTLEEFLRCEKYPYFPPVCYTAIRAVHTDHDMEYVYNSSPSIRYIDNHDAAACN